MKIVIQNNQFILHHYGSMFWEEKNILLISDLHLGKIAHFRKNGLAIPNDAIYENFDKLNELVEIYNPFTIIFLGDLFHSTINSEWELFSDWVKLLSQKIILIEGNHDIIDKNKFKQLNIQIANELIIDNFYLTHHPNEKTGFFNFCGHVHPGIRLRGKGKQYLNLSCFFRKPKQLIFPAFGEFTGNFYLTPTENDLVYGITKEGVFEVVIN